MPDYSQRIKELRMLHGWTQDELARRILVTKSAVSQYEHGRRRPDQETLLALCDVFNVGADYLLGLDGVTIRLVDPMNENFHLYGNERDIIEAYRAADEGTRSAVRKLLDIEDKKTRTSAS